MTFVLRTRVHSLLVGQTFLPLASALAPKECHGEPLTANTIRSYARFNQGLAKKYGDWMVAMHYAKNTQHIYRRTIRRYVEFMGKTRLQTPTMKIFDDTLRAFLKTA